jgi:predicted HTH transcriptional regulator
MHKREFAEILENGESAGVEFKRTFSSFERIAKEIVAFTNSHGGMLIVGVDDDRSVVGVESEKEEIAMIQHSAEFFCIPPVATTIEVFAYKGKDVVIVHVPESDEKPHFVLEPGTREERPRKRAYVRHLDRSVQASRESVRVMLGRRPESQPVKLSIGEPERRLFTYLESNERITLEEFCRLVNISRRRASGILVALVRAGALTLHDYEAHDFYTLAS